MVFDSSCLGWYRTARGTGPMWRATQDTRGSLFFFRRLITNWGAPPRCFLRFFLSDQARSRCFWMHSQSPRDGWRRDYAQDVFLGVRSLSRLARLGRAYRKSVDPMFDITRFVGTRLLSSPGTRVYVIIPGNIGACEIALRRFSRLA